MKQKLTAIKGPAKRILAVALSLVLVNSVVDYSGIITASAKTGNQPDKVITTFADLSSSVKEQTLPLGAEESDIKLPKSLKVTIETESEETATEEVTSEEATTEETKQEDTKTAEETSTVEKEEPAATETSTEGKKDETTPETNGEVTTTTTENAVVNTPAEDPKPQAEATPSSDITSDSGNEDNTDDENADPPSGDEDTEQTPTGNEDAKADILTSIWNSVETTFSMGTVYAAEATDTTKKTEEVTLTDITWKLDAKKSDNDTFQGGIAPEDYFSDFDEDGEAIETDTETWMDYFKQNKDTNGKKYTYVAELPEGYQLADGVELPEIIVTVGMPEMTTLGTIGSTEQLSTSVVKMVKKSDGTTTYHDSFDEAYSTNFACQNDCTLTLLKDGTLSSNASLQSKVILDLNGHTLTLNKNWNTEAGSALTIKGNGTIDTLYDGGDEQIVVSTGASLTTDADGSGTINVSISVSTNASLSLNGAFTYGGIITIYSGSTVTITNGTFTSITLGNNVTAASLLPADGSYCYYKDGNYVDSASVAESSYISNVTVGKLPVEITTDGQPIGGVQGTELKVVATKSESAGNKAISYQWYKKGATVADDTAVDGATSSTYIANEIGDYYCAVKCAEYTVNSTTATVAAAPVKLENGTKTSYYGTLQEAITDAEKSENNGCTVTMMQTGQEYITEDVTISGGTFTLDLGKGTNVYSTLLSTDTPLTIKGGNIIVQNGMIQSGNNKPAISITDGKLTLANTCIINLNNKTNKAGLQIDGGEVVVAANDNDSSKSAMIYGTTIQDGGELTINGGGFYGDVKLNSGTTTLNGGAFTKTITATGKTVGELLGNGYCYYDNGNFKWVTDTNQTTLTKVKVVQAPVTITKQPETNIRATYGADAPTVIVAATTSAGNKVFYTGKLEGTTNDETEFPVVTYDDYSGNSGADVSFNLMALNSQNLKAGTYTFSVTAYNTNYNTSDYVVTFDTVTITINRADGSLTNKTVGGYGNSYTYTGSAITAPTDSNFDNTAGTLSYEWYTGNPVAADATPLSTTPPTDAGIYTLVVKAAETGNIDSAELRIPVTIDRIDLKAENFSYNAPTSLTYDGTAKTAEVTYHSGVTGAGGITVWYQKNDSTEFITEPKDAGTYKVFVTVTEGKNYNAVTEKLALNESFTIAKKTLTDEMFILAEPNYYTGNKLTPTITINSTESTLTSNDYSVEYGENIAVGTEAGSVTITGKGNYSGEIVKKFAITYIPAPTSYISGTEGSDGWYTSDVVIGATDWSVSEDGMNYTSSISLTTDGTYTKELYFKNTAGQITAAQNVTIKIDQTAPTEGKITIASKGWASFLQAISFGRYQATTRTVTITGRDTGSGIRDDADSTISYIIVEGNTQYTTKEALEAAVQTGAVSWATYQKSSQPTVNANEDVVVYGKISDVAGNVSYVSTDGILFDTTPPAITNQEVSSTEGDMTDSSAKLRFTVSEAGKYYYVVLPADSSVSAPEAKNIIATVSTTELGAEGGTAITGAASYGSGSCTAGNVEVTVSKLSSNTAYKIYLAATDAPMTNIDGATAKQVVNTSTVAAVASFTTRKKNLQTAVVTLKNTDGFVYTGSSQIPTVEVTLDGEPLGTDQYEAVYTNSNTTNAEKLTVYAGTVTVSIKATETGNYSGSTTGQEAGTKTYTIAPKTVTAVVTADNKNYDETTAATIISQTISTGIDGEVLSLTGITGTFVDATAENDKTVTLVTSSASVTAGNDVTAVSNYSVSYPATTTANITPAPAEITIADANKTVNKTFGDAVFSLEGISHKGDGTLAYVVTDSKNAANTGVAIDKVITVSPEGKVTIVGAGTATITVSMGATTNYEAATSQNITVTVSKKPLTNGTDSRSYAFAAGSGDDAVQINVATVGNLPGDRGTTSYTLGSVTDANTILVADSYSVDNTGVLTYKVAKDKTVGNTATIPVTVTMENYADYTYTLTIHITDKTAVEIKPGTEVTINGSNVLTYGDALSKLTFKSAVFVEQGTDKEVAGTLAWTDAATKPDAGTTTASWTFTPENGNVYAAVTGNAAIVVNQAQGTVTNKAVSDGGYQIEYTFTGSEIIAAPASTNFDTNSGSSTFTFTWYRDSVKEDNKLPAGTRPSEKGSYILRVVAAGTTNYTEASADVDVTIKKFVPEPMVAATLADTNKGAGDWYHGDVTVSAPAGYTISTEQTGSFGGSLTVNADQNGNFTYYLKQGTTEYITEAMTITVMRDTVLPTAKVTVKEKWWQSFLSTITFGLYTNNLDTITINAEDTAGTANSGIGTVEYYISSTPYVGAEGLNSLKTQNDIVWNTYDSGSRPTVSQDTISYVYVRVTDKAGNVSYVSTDGIVCDKTAPTLTLTPTGAVYTEKTSPATGITAYTGDISVKVDAADTVAGENTLDSIKYVLDNGTETTMTSGGTFQITGRGSHTVAVTATDKAGNVTSKTLTVRIYGAAPTVTIAPASNITYDGTVVAEGTDFTLNKGGSAGAVTYFHKVQGTDDSTYVSGLPINAGNYTIKAVVAEDSTGCYPAAEQTANLTIAQAAPAITLATSVNRTNGIGIDLTATMEGVQNGSTPTGSVTFYDTTAGSNNKLATVTITSGKAAYSYTGLSTQIYKIKVVYEGDTNYKTVTSTEHSVDTEKQNQAAFAIGSIGAKTYGNPAFVLSTTGGSGTGEVTFTSSDSSILSISDNMATIHKAGTVTITATKAGDNAYNPITVQTSLTIGRKALTITADNKLNVIKGSTMPTFTYTQNGLVNGDTIATAPTMTTSAADTNTLGEYTISISGAVVSNADSYAVTYVNGKMTVVNQVYAVTVTSGTATVDGTAITEASEGQQITVKASDRSGYTFKNWSSNAGGTFANANAATTTFTMPAGAVTITANYTQNSNGGGSGSGSGGGSGSGDSGNGGTTTTPSTPTTPTENQAPSQTPVAPTETPAQTQRPAQQTTPTQTPVEPTDTKAPFIEGKNGEQGWDAITSDITDTFTKALSDAGIDVSAIVNEDGKIDLNKLAENPEVLDALSNLEEPLAVTVDMNGATELPADIISLIAGKNIDLTLEMTEGISWIINGNSVTGENFSDIDLNVTKNADKIPVDIVNQVTGENYSMQIELSHNGEFGFTATLNINLEKKNAGYYANLFYFNEETEALEFMGTAQIDEDGNAALDFVHASAYTIVVSAEPMSADSVADAGESDKEGQTDTETTGTTVEATDETSGSMMALWIVLGIVVIIAIGGGLYLMKRKKETEE